MSQLTESAAALLPPAQAANLLQVIEREACWKNLLHGPATGGGGAAPADRLVRLQAAFADFRSLAGDYAARYRTDRMPSHSPGGPVRLATWVRTVRAVWARAAGEPGTEPPVQVVGYAVRMADRITGRAGTGYVSTTGTPGDAVAAIAALDAVVRWCDEQRGTTGAIAGRTRAG